MIHLMRERCIVFPDQTVLTPEIRAPGDFRP
jgi:hypothetical protein